MRYHLFTKRQKNATKKLRQKQPPKPSELKPKKRLTVKSLKLKKPQRKPRGKLRNNVCPQMQKAVFAGFLSVFLVAGSLLLH